MKKLCFQLFLVFLPFISSGQILKLYATDALGNRDSVQIGLDWTATIGIDTAFNEVNLFGLPPDSVLDMRVIQRDSGNHLCLKENPFISFPPPLPVYFPENLDLKTDIRSMDFMQQDLWRNVQIRIQAQHYPIVISADLSSPFFSSALAGWSAKFTIDSLCAYGQFGGLGFNPSDTLALIGSAGIHSFGVYFDHEAGRAELEEKNTWKVIQNPVSSVLAIQLQHPETGQMQVLDGLGRVIATFSLRGTEVEQFAIQTFPTGLYFVRLQTALNPVGRLKKILKQ